MTGVFKLIIFFFTPFIFGVDSYVSCDKDPIKQKARSEELKLIHDADQADRKPPIPPDLAFRDRERRRRVGEIFGEGCINSAADYQHAGLVFQHGDRPDHFFQTFLFAMRGYKLGDPNQKRLAALGIDRYLVNTGQKQLFASQIKRKDIFSCWCLCQVEATFPEEMRKEYMGNGLAEQFAWVDEMNKGPLPCGPAKYCDENLKDSPKGTVPGLW